MNILRFMIPKSLSVHLDCESTVRQALEKMRYHRYAAVPVIDREGAYVGTLRNDDILKYFLEIGGVDMRSAERTPVMEIIDKSYSAPLSHEATLKELIERVKEHNFVPVVDDRGVFIGIVLRRDVLNYLLEFYNSKHNDSDGRL